MAETGTREIDTIDLATLTPAVTGKLCARCQNFDIHSFAKTPSRRRGYTYRDVESNAEEGVCDFCALLWDSVREVAPPKYFYASSIPGWLRTTTPDLYVHMTVSRNHEAPSTDQGPPLLSANRLLVQVGDRFSDVRNDSPHELCLAADEGR